MNKILIALVLAVVMSGNVFAFFKFDGSVTYSYCMEIIEKGKLIANQDFDELYTYNYYFYKEDVYQVGFSLSDNSMSCRFINTKY